jgi:hypothetical protein
MKNENLIPRIGTTVDLVLNPGRIRRTRIHDIIGNLFLLFDSQHTFLADDGKQSAILSFLPVEQPNTRHGFDVVFVSLPDDYNKNPHLHTVFCVLKTSATHQMELRMFPRIAITGLRIALDGEPLDILNVSAGGAHLCLKKKPLKPLRAGDTVLLALTRYGEILEKKAKIIRRWRVQGFSGIEHIAVKFLQPVDF